MAAPVIHRSMLTQRWPWLETHIKLFGKYEYTSFAPKIASFSVDP